MFGRSCAPPRVAPLIRLGLVLALAAPACSQEPTVPTPPRLAASPCSQDGGWTGGWRGCVQFVGRLVDAANQPIPMPAVDVRAPDAASSYIPDSLASDSTGRFVVRLTVAAAPAVSAPTDPMRFYVRYARTTGVLFNVGSAVGRDSVLLNAVVRPRPEVPYEYDVGTRRLP